MILSIFMVKRKVNVVIMGNNEVCITTHKYTQSHSHTVTNTHTHTRMHTHTHTAILSYLLYQIPHVYPVSWDCKNVLLMQ